MYATETHSRILSTLTGGLIIRRPPKNESWRSYLDRTPREWFIRRAERICAQFAASNRPWPEVDAIRAGGDVECDVCGLPLHDHPWATEPENLTRIEGDPYPYLHRGCRGELWKL